MAGRDPLPPTTGAFFLTDGGLETTLTFLEGLELPCFASFPLLLDPQGRERLERYYAPYLRTARERRVGFLLDTPTWRANPDWGAKLGYDAGAIDRINREAVAWAKGMRERHAAPDTPVVINGVVGPRGDGYRPDATTGPEEAQAYHAAQIAAFREAGADLASAMTLSTAEEAIGITRAAQAEGLPVVISFTVETNGALATGESLRDAVRRVDEATDGGPAYFMVNCAHPTHFEAVLAGGGWTTRIHGIRANASAKSHAELDESTQLDIGDPAELGRQYRSLRDRLGHLRILGGCCGTNHRHIAAIAEACLA
ncbi:MAG: homocysteine S-methyltransferase family protein [Microvirga sp.]